MSGSYWLKDFHPEWNYGEAWCAIQCSRRCTFHHWNHCFIRTSWLCLIYLLLFRFISLFEKGNHGHDRVLIHTCCDKLAGCYLRKTPPVSTKTPHYIIQDRPSGLSPVWLTVRNSHEMNCHVSESGSLGPRHLRVIQEPNKARKMWKMPRQQGKSLVTRQSCRVSWSTCSVQVTQTRMILTPGNAKPHIWEWRVLDLYGGQ